MRHRRDGRPPLFRADRPAFAFLTLRRELRPAGPELSGIQTWIALPQADAFQLPDVRAIAQLDGNQALLYVQRVEGTRPDVQLEMINAGNDAQLTFLPETALTGEGDLIVFPSSVVMVSSGIGFGFLTNRTRAFPVAVLTLPLVPAVVEPTISPSL